MAKRGYKLQEFVAHTTNVNCLNIGKKNCRLFVTGGDDHKVNLWAIGKPTSLMSLCGHTGPVESVVFDTSEVLVLAGASTGAVKLWDLDEAKMVRTLTGHRSNCTAVEFHPFGEFFASGSTDTNLRIWDIRKKGCIHTYRGHTQGISTIRFSPDGRWVVSGGFDNVVKIWDLTAGKLLHDFKFHEGYITSLDFHPLEFLLATGSADRTVKFWDLETFELIGSSRPEATGVSSIAFHPDGRTLFCGLDDGLKVYSWEPVICHDSVDMGWSTLGDICIHEGKLLGCSYYRNSVGVWVADVSLIEPYGSGPVPEESECTDNKFDIARMHSSDKTGRGVRVTSGLCPRSPEYEIKGIKNIYVDSTGGNPVTPQRVGSLSSPKVILPLDSKEMINPLTEKQSPAVGVNAKSNEQAHNKSSIAPTVVPRDDLVEKDSSISGKERVTFSRTKPGMLLRPAHVRKQSNCKNEIEKMSMSLDSGTFNNMKIENRIVSGDEAKKPAHRRRPSIVKNDLEKLSLSHESGMSNKVPGTDEYVMDQNLQSPIVSEDGAQESGIKSIAETFDTVLSSKPPSNEGKCDINGSKGVTSVKIVNGVAVVAGRTRTLVERFERRERFSSEDQTSTMTTPAGTETESTSSVNNNMTKHEITEVDRTVKVASSLSNCATPEIDGTSSEASIKIPCILTETDRIPFTGSSINLHATQEMDRTPVIASNTALCHMTETNTPPIITSSMNLHMIPGTDRRSSVTSNMNLHATTETDRSSNVASNMNLHATPETDRSSSVASNMSLHATPEADRSSSVASNMNLHATPEADRSSSVASNMNLHVTLEADRRSSVASNMNLHPTPEADRRSSVVSNMNLHMTPEADRRSSVASNMNLHAAPETDRSSSFASNMILHATPAAHRRSSVRSNMNLHSTPGTDRRSYVASNKSLRAIPERDRRRIIATNMASRVIHEVNRAPSLAPRMPPRGIREMDKSPPAREMDKSPPAQKEEPQISGRDSASSNDRDIIEDLMRGHDAFLSTLKSRLTKLQVVRHFWERNDIKGAINALKKLPDQSVQADVISVLTERIEILTLDFFSCLLPVLVGLLDSRMERHANVSLEMLVKLVAVFGSVIRSTVSAPPTIGVDLHAEERRECCNQCFTQLQKIQQILPALTRKGGPLAKCAMELNLVLQVH